MRLVRRAARRRAGLAGRRQVPQHQPRACRGSRDGQSAFKLEFTRDSTSQGGKPPARRFKPTRAGIINLWDYLDEEFSFADGRLALRGHNGSGKTKALEVLFPFVLDGSLDARRLDPFSGENRTMKANVLYRGQDAEHGYVWMEFARQGGRGGRETVTLIIGLVAHQNRDRPGRRST